MARPLCEALIRPHGNDQRDSSSDSACRPGVRASPFGNDLPEQNAAHAALQGSARIHRGVGHVEAKPGTPWQQHGHICDEGHDDRHHRGELRKIETASGNSADAGRGR